MICTALGLLSANALNLEQSKILSLGKDLTLGTPYLFLLEPYGFNPFPNNKF